MSQSCASFLCLFIYSCHFFILSPWSPIWISSKQLEYLHSQSHLQWVEEWWGCLAFTTKIWLQKNPSNWKQLWKFWQCKLCQDQSKNNKPNKHNEILLKRGVLTVLSTMAPREQGSNATSRSFINDAQRTSPRNSCRIMQTMTQMLLMLPTHLKSSWM